MNEQGKIKTRHVFEHDPRKFEQLLNEALERIQTEGGIIESVLYASDPASDTDRRGGFGALVIYELTL